MYNQTTSEVTNNFGFECPIQLFTLPYTESFRKEIENNKFHCLLISSSCSNMNSVVHTRGLDPFSFSFHKTVLFLQLFAVQLHANFQVHLSLSLYCSNFDQKIFRKRCFKPFPSLKSIF